MAGRQRADLAILILGKFSVNRPEDLSIREASTLIDDLKRGPVDVRNLDYGSQCANVATISDFQDFQHLAQHFLLN